MLPIDGCSPGFALSNERSEALLAEIESMAADRSSSTDDDCGVVDLVCGAPTEYIVYSRATVNEELLLEKVHQYNELTLFMGRTYGLASGCVDQTLLQARSENGVCVGGAR
jgi:hypothetical protein